MSKTLFPIEKQLYILEKIVEFKNKPTKSLKEELAKMAIVKGMLEAYEKNFINK